MSKTRDTGFLANVIQVHDTGVRIMSGSEMLMAISSSGAVTITGELSGSDAANSLLLDGTGSLAFTTTASYNAFSASYGIASASLSSRTTQVERTYATTGSNTFTGPQYISNTSNAIGFTSTASLYSDGGLRVRGNSFVSGTAYFNNIVVYGTSSIQYITSSQVNIGANIITVNTDTPAIRFGGLSVFDSGSTQLTGSILWDSEKNHWVYSNPSGSTYSGGMFISGPRSSALGSEQGTTACMLLVGQGSDHLTSSMIYHSSTCTNFYSNALFISSSGNVGIGCASPTIKLSVQDHNTADRFCNIAVFGNSTPSARLYIKDEDGIGQNPSGIYNDTGYGVGIYNLGSGVNAGVKIFTGSPISQRLWINASGIACFSCSVCAQNVDIRGILRVGINQTANTDIRIDNACSGKIHYIFSDAATGDLGIEAGSGTGIKFNTSGPFTKMYLNSSGNLGIGISCPSVKLHVLASSAAMATLASESANGGWLRFARSTSTIYGYVGSGYELVSGGGANDFAVTAESSNLLFATSGGTERMRIASTGLVTFNCMIAAQGGCFSSRSDARALYIKQNIAGTDNIIQFIDHTNTFAWEIVGRNSVFYVYNNASGNFSMCINPATNAVHFPGAVSKGSGTFNIEHPLESKKCTHRLVHSFIEGPQADLIYRGKINLESGIACVNIDCAARMTQGTFEALNRCSQVFTTNESSWDAIRGKLHGNILVIESENTESQDEISWMVIGERQDKHIKETSITDTFGRIIVEPEVEEQFTCICV